MSETPKYFFGLKAAIFYNLLTFVPVGIFKVLSSFEFAREIEKLPLTGGHHNGAHAVEAGEPVNTLTGTLKEFPNFAFTELDNASLTSIAGEDTSGFVDTIANKVGSSVFDATTGIASVAAIPGSENKLPLGTIIFKATSVADEVDVYLLGDTATGAIPIIGELPLLAAGVVIPDTGGTIDIPDIGITITGGSGTIAFTEDDTAFFKTRPSNSITTEIVMGNDSCLKNLGCILVYPKNSEGQQTIVDFHKVSVGGTPFSAATRDYAEFEMSAMVLIDENDKLYTKTSIVATNLDC